MPGGLLVIKQYELSTILALRQRRQIVVNEIQNEHAFLCKALESLELLKDGQGILSFEEPLICRTCIDIYKGYGQAFLSI